MHAAISLRTPYFSVCFKLAEVTLEMPLLLCNQGTLPRATSLGQLSSWHWLGRRVPLAGTCRLDQGEVGIYFGLHFKRCKWLPKCKARHLPAPGSGGEEDPLRHTGDEWDVFSAGQAQQVLGEELGLSLTWDII